MKIINYDPRKYPRDNAPMAYRLPMCFKKWQTRHFPRAGLKSHYPNPSAEGKFLHTIRAIYFSAAVRIRHHGAKGREKP